MTKKPIAVLACAAAALVLTGPLKARSGRPAAELPFPLIERFEHFGPLGRDLAGPEPDQRRKDRDVHTDE